MKNLPKSAVLCVALVLLAGCGSSMDARIQRLELGMSRDKVIRTVGHEYRTVGAREDAEGRRTEVLRFEDAEAGEFFAYLRDDKLVQWGDVRALQNVPQ